jgi:hypothetical protein
MWCAVLRAAHMPCGVLLAIDGLVRCPLKHHPFSIPNQGKAPNSNLLPSMTTQKPKNPKTQPPGTLTLVLMLMLP